MLAIQIAIGFGSTCQTFHFKVYCNWLKKDDEGMNGTLARKTSLPENLSNVQIPNVDKCFIVECPVQTRDSELYGEQTRGVQSAVTIRLLCIVSLVLYLVTTDDDKANNEIREPFQSGNDLLFNVNASSCQQRMSIRQQSSCEP